MTKVKRNNMQILLFIYAIYTPIRYTTRHHYWGRCDAVFIMINGVYTRKVTTRILYMRTSWHRKTLRITGPFHRPSVDCPDEGPVMPSFDCFFGVSPNKLFSKHWSHRWTETPRRGCDITLMKDIQLLSTCARFKVTDLGNDLKP